MEDWVYCIIFWDLPAVYLQKPLFYHCIDTPMEPALNLATFASWTQIKDFHFFIVKKMNYFLSKSSSLTISRSVAFQKWCKPQYQVLTTNVSEHFPLLTMGLCVLFLLWQAILKTVCSSICVCRLQVTVLFVLYTRVGTTIWIAPSWRASHKTMKRKKWVKLRRKQTHKSINTMYQNTTASTDQCLYWMSEIAEKENRCNDSHY